MSVKGPILLKIVSPSEPVLSTLVEKLSPVQQKVEKLELKEEITPTTLEIPKPLKGSIVASKLATSFEEQFQLSEKLQGLSEAEQEKIFSECLKSYQQAFEQYEVCATVELFKDPEAMKFAEQLAQRLAKVVEAYNEINLNKETAPATSERPLPLEVLRELKQAVIFGQVFGSTSKAAGSVGFNSLAIQKVLKEGNMRERLTLVYASAAFVVGEICKNKQNIEKVNEKLEKMGAGFQLNTDAIEEDRSKMKPGERLTKAVDVVEDFRKKRGRTPKKVLPHQQVRGQRLSEIRDLSIREARAGVQDYISEESFEAMKAGKNEDLGERRVEWLSSAKIWSCDTNSDFAKEIRKLGLPSSSLIAGPSGTTDYILHMAKYLGLGDQLDAGTKACIAWIAPEQEKFHSAHEVLIAAHPYGFPYAGTAKDFDTCFGKDIGEKISQEMKKNGFKMPSYYLNEEHQLEIAANMNKENFSLRRRIRGG